MASQRQVALAWLTMLAALAVTSFAAPLRNAQDCVTPTLLKLVDQRVFPSAHQIQSTSVVTLQDRTTVTVAQDFSVTYYDTFKVVKNLNVKVNETYLLYQCGTTPPSDLAAYDLPANTKVLSIPLMSVSAEDTSILYFMKQLGVADRVGYVTSYAVDPCMQALLAPGCGRNDSMATADVVDATFTYGKNDKDATSIAFTATADPGPLNRAEHIKYVAAFFNREAIANTIFRTISAKYDATRQMVSSYVTSTAAMKPLVAWITYFPAYDSPSYKSPASIYLYFKAYRKDYTEDAGARTFDPIALNATYGNGKTIRISSDRDIIFSDLDNTRATLRTILKDVDVLIDESYYGGRNPTTITIDDFRTMYGFTAESDMTDFKFLATQRVLRLDGVATNDGSQGWLEEAVARPDEVLRDLAGFFQPGAFVASNDPNSGPVAPRFARTLFVSASKPSTVLVTSAAQCPANQLTCGGAPAPVCPAYYIDCSGKPTVATESQPCAPTCKPSVNTPAPVNQPGAAGRVAFAPALLAALLAVALAAVAGFAC